MTIPYCSAILRRTSETSYYTKLSLAYEMHDTFLSSFYKDFPSLKKLSFSVIHRPLFFICAGEPSGDLLGANLIKALKELYPTAEFLGIGGPLMEKEGLFSLFPLDELAIIGIIEILPKALSILKRIQTVAQFITQLSPSAVITIDAPAFSFRLGKALRKLHKESPIPHIHVVAPTVWAWRPKRAYKISKFLTHLLTLFPFEPLYFEKHKLSTTFIGHPLIETNYADINPETFRKKYDIGKGLPLLLLLPGSRTSELNCHMPIFLKAIQILYNKGFTFACVLPTFPKFEATIHAALQKCPCPVPIYITTNEEDKKEAFKSSTIALAASGTVTLELACAEVPSLITYKASPLTAFIVKRMLAIPYVGMPNILLKKMVIPELLQENCTPEILAQHLEKLLTSQEEQQKQKDYFKKVQTLLQPKDPTLSPSQTAAQAIQKVLSIPK